MPERHLYKKLNLEYYRDRKDAPNAIKGFVDAYAFLSNFSYSPYVLYGHEFKWSEQGYMWEKDDRKTYRSKIMRAQSPGACKRIGYSAKLLPDWDETRRYKAMFNHVFAKFSVPKAEELLLNTGYAYLEETNNHGDTHWGAVQRGGFSEGTNHLGRILMCVRTLKQRKLG